MQRTAAVNGVRDTRVRIPAGILLMVLVQSILIVGGALPGLAWAGSPAAFEHDDLNAILEATVRDEGVDYESIREKHLSALDGYLARIAEFDDTALSRDARLALLINLYNATMIRAVSDRLTADYSPSADSFAIFDEPLARLAGKRISLNHLEHKIIRPEFGDARIHAALVCAARSCPPLIPRAYLADDLDRVLEANMRRFVRDTKRNRIDAAGRTLQLSQIFEWYAEDFGGPSGLPAYVERYAGKRVAGYAVSHLPYSWELNRAP